MIIKGNSADANADFLRAGHEEVIGEAVTAGDIEIVGETYTDNWDPAHRPDEHGAVPDRREQRDRRRPRSENDGMAGGVIAALEAQGLAGEVPVSGQDGDQPALNRVALGTQTVDVWKDARELGKAAGEAASRALRQPGRLAAVEGTAPFTTPGGVEVNSILLDADLRSHRTTSTSCSTPDGSTRRRSARASRPVRWQPAADRRLITR